MTDDDERRGARILEESLEARLGPARDERAALVHLGNEPEVLELATYDGLSRDVDAAVEDAAAETEPMLALRHHPDRQRERVPERTALEERPCFVEARRKHVQLAGDVGSHEWAVAEVDRSPEGRRQREIAA